MENQDAPQTSTRNDKKMEAAQAQVKAVTDIMKQNVEKIVKRGEALEELDRRAEVLEHGSSHFHTRTRQVRDRYWWQNMKMNIIIGSIAVIIIIVIIVWATR